MDELVIGDKKYISSKQAAKATGYAKDYIGQLCREGRVPARLVGRSWYVLESAIHDHRFSEKSETPKKEEATVVSPLQATWDSPRYEASEENPVPLVDRLKNKPVPSDAEADLEVARHLQDTWQAWFNRFDPPAPPVTQENVSPAKEPEVVKEIKQEREEVKIPVHVRALHHTPQVELRPREIKESQPLFVEEKREEPYIAPNAQKGMSRRFVKNIQFSGAVLAVISLVLALLGTGYFDQYLISSKPARLVAGVSLYNK